MRKPPGRAKKVAAIVGRVDYVQPGGSMLFDREVYTSESLAAEELAKSDPDAYAQRVREGYMPGSGEEAPSVITVNMRAASMVVQEFLARLMPYRFEKNELYARTIFELLSLEEEHTAESAFSRAGVGIFATGLVSPLLGLPALGSGS